MRLVACGVRASIQADVLFFVWDRASGAPKKQRRRPKGKMYLQVVGSCRAGRLATMKIFSWKVGLRLFFTGSVLPMKVHPG